MSEPLPVGNLFWKHIKPADIIEERPNVFIVHRSEEDGPGEYVANWQSIDAKEAQAWLKKRARADANRKCDICGAPYAVGHECPSL